MNSRRLPRSPLRRMPPVHPRDRRFGEYVSLGRDVPYTISTDGIPLPDLLYRVIDYGPGPWGQNGLRHETKCPHCQEWLSYMTRDEAATIYGRCEDHVWWEQGPYSRS